MKRNLIIGLVALLVVAFLGAYFASPWLALGALRKAAETGDKARLEQLVDFPSVREGLKSDFRDFMSARMEADPELRDNPFAGLAMAFAPALADRAVDAAITPEGIARMARGESGFTNLEGEAESPPKAKDAAPGNPEPKNETQIRSGYQSLDRFKVSQTNDGKTVGWIFERDGLFGWRLVRIDLGDVLKDEAKAP